MTLRYARYASTLSGIKLILKWRVAVTGLRNILGAMSRPRRLVVSDDWFFITCRVLPGRGILTASEFAGLGGVIHERREKRGFLLSAGVFLPDHWHAIFYPSYPLTISRVMESIKVGATKRINRSRGEVGWRFQPRFFDRALRR